MTISCIINIAMSLQGRRWFAVEKTANRCVHQYLLTLLCRCKDVDDDDDDNDDDVDDDDDDKHDWWWSFVPLFSPGLTVKCTSEYMEVGVDTNVHTEIQPDTLTLEDKNCKLSRSEGSILYFKTALDGCGTRHNTTEDDIVYYNSIYAETTAGSNSAKISRAFQAEFPFKCTFPRSAVLSVVNFSPKKKVLYSTACK